jgi:hypothetical protein
MYRTIDKTHAESHACMHRGWGHTREIFRVDRSIQGEGRIGELISRSRGGATDKGKEHTTQQHYWSLTDWSECIYNP